VDNKDKSATVKDNNQNKDSFLSVIAPWLGQLDPNTQRLLEFILGGSLVSFTASRLLKSSREDSAQFDQSNLIWMITLLRRYLFICYRCGIEPVLVINELDKLGGDELSSMFPQVKSPVQPEATPSERPESTIPAQPKAKPDKLDAFLQAFTLLKAKLGAEFLWTLIGGYGLAIRLQAEEQHWRSGLCRSLATVIHQHIVLSPASVTAIRGFLQELDDKLLPRTGLLWILSGGNMATLAKLCESGDFVGAHDTAMADGIALLIAELWTAEKQAGYLRQKGRMGQCLHTLRQVWAQTWVRVGMVFLARRCVLAQDFQSTFSERSDPFHYKYYQSTRHDYLQTALREALPRYM